MNNVLSLAELYPPSHIFCLEICCLLFNRRENGEDPAALTSFKKTFLAELTEISELTHNKSVLRSAYLPVHN